MNKLNIADTGYPGTTESWKFIKDSYEMIADLLGKIIDINDAVILTGMKVTGSDISDGYMSYNGEIYQFKGGTFTGTIVLVQDVTNVEYNTDPANSGQLQSLPTYYKRYARNGQAGEGFKDIAYDDFVRLDSLINISERTKQATEDKKGIAEIATQAEANGGTDDSHIITPKKLAARTATETRKGLAEIATQSEVNAGTDDTKIVTPKKLKDSIIKGVLNFGNTGSEFIINLPVAITNADYTVSGSIIPGDNDKRALFYVIMEKNPDNFKVQFFLADHIGAGVIFTNDSTFEYIVIRN